MTPEIQNDQRGLSQNQSLFQLETELVELMSLREEMVEAGEDTAPIDNQLSEYVRREIAKVDNIRGYLRHCDVMLATATDEAERLCDLAAVWRTRRDRLKECCRITMEAVGAKRIEGQTGSISLKGNGGPAPLEITNESLIPNGLVDYHIVVKFDILCQLWDELAALGVPGKVAYDRFLSRMTSYQRTPNNTRIRESISRGEAVPGARLGERGAHIEIR